MNLFKSSTCVVLVACLLAMSPQLIAGKNVDVSGTLDMISPEASTLSSTPYPSYGDEVRFNVDVNGRLANNSRIYVTVVCSQEEQVVYQASAWTDDFAFTMEDLPGQGLYWDGEPAMCTANLIYREQKGKSYVLYWLDTLPYVVN